MATREPANHEGDDRLRLATYVQKRRRELGLSVRAAAERGALARGTWTALEDGTRRTSDSNYAGIERALFWQPGSVEAVLAGRKPTHLPVSTGHTSGASTTTYTTSAGTVTVDTRADPGAGIGFNPDDEALVRVMRSNLPDAKKRALVKLLTAEREAAEQQRVERAEQLIRLVGDDPE